MITVELSVKSDAKENPFTHYEKTEFGNLNEADKKTLAVLEVGNAASHTVTADIALKAVATDVKPLTPQ